MNYSEPFSKIAQTLKFFARSFYLSLILFPNPVKKQISIAYLFCKIADTIVDQKQTEKWDREKLLKEFEGLVHGSVSIAEFMKKVEVLPVPDYFYALISALPPAILLFHNFTLEDQNLILELFEQVMNGMKRDLKGGALENEEELDRYCYHVAGSAGKFLTELSYRYRYILQDHDEMIFLGEQLGKGLQLTNIIRDQNEDRTMNRIYLPSGARFASDLFIFRKTLSYFNDGLKFVTRLPRSSWRIRLASLWPLLFALKTLSKCRKLSSIPSGNSKIKIGRLELYRTMLISSILIFSNYGIAEYFNFMKVRCSALEKGA
ncbi:MAG: squalene/phytoene synthase family protein [Nitrospirae bacterium]|nr:squalene/phytoene synthase family protein [Nitrospirota bacterium]MBI3593542.1 squalene/phytoene synthase family protein [Nitrospirota bacterium]